MSIFSIFKRHEPLTVTEALKQPPFDAWPKLKALGYTMQRYSAGGGKSCYSFWLDGDMVSDDWSRPLTVDESTDMREQWAQIELARLEQEARK